ncbi:uncharacterized protein BDR25DRAFT_351544 [Lindgomyces ingoldianus]|uniref:Uncharacterized protein n=1 Tax=Lindgomyces ingoldianus TaxID=673940 RepID=A0ACB6R7A8_9PLEO|nr:uncharacterized protein BDR25DRAFT_351544 [Lindgomyces ingoldianus]KAF2475066.1 hypothetical protein BDR25DRAFT_351544 [Lindgomyces ingoldianus]
MALRRGNAGGAPWESQRVNNPNRDRPTRPRYPSPLVIFHDRPHRDYEKFRAEKYDKYFYFAPLKLCTHFSVLEHEGTFTTSGFKDLLLWQNRLLCDRTIITLFVSKLLSALWLLSHEDSHKASVIRSDVSHPVAVQSPSTRADPSSVGLPASNHQLSALELLTEIVTAQGHGQGGSAVLSVSVIKVLAVCSLHLQTPLSQIKNMPAYNALAVTRSQLRPFYLFVPIQPPRETCE